MQIKAILHALRQRTLPQANNTRDVIMLKELRNASTHIPKGIHFGGYHRTFNCIDYFLAI